MEKILFLVFPLLAFVALIEAQKCDTGKDCKEDRCCVTKIPGRFWIPKGYCKKFLKEGEECMPDFLHDMAGKGKYFVKCPCQEGLECEKKHKYSQKRMCINPDQPSSTAQPTSQSTSQPTSQSTSQPTSQSTSQPTSPSTSQPTSPSTSQPTSPSTSQPTSPSTSQPNSSSTSQSTAKFEISSEKQETAAGEVKTSAFVTDENVDVSTDNAVSTSTT